MSYNANKEPLASVYERHNENSLIPPLKNRFCFFACCMNLLASVYEQSNDVFALQKA